jgi:hypothetical protein
VKDVILVCRAHEQYGYCQAGTSGLLLDDTAVIGTPGPYTWRGTVFVISVSENFLNRDKTIYHGPLLEHESPVDKYSYLGKSYISCMLKKMYVSAECLALFTRLSGLDWLIDGLLLIHLH